MTTVPSFFWPRGSRSVAQTRVGRVLSTLNFLNRPGVRVFDFLNAVDVKKPKTENSARRLLRFGIVTNVSVDFYDKRNKYDTNRAGSTIWFNNGGVRRFTTFLNDQRGRVCTV